MHLLHDSDYGGGVGSCIYYKILDGRIQYKRRFLCALLLPVFSCSFHLQIRLASVDLELHIKYVPGGSESIFDIDQMVSERTQKLPPLPEKIGFFVVSTVYLLVCFSLLNFHEPLFFL